MKDVLKTFQVSLFLMLLFSCQTVFALQSASLRVQVLDPSGDKVANAKVRLKKYKKVVFERHFTDKRQKILENLTLGEFVLEIEAKGFRRLNKKISIKPGTNELTFTLEIEKIIENVDIEKDAQEKSIKEILGGFYTKEQIEALPETPEGIKKALKNRYGPDTIIRIDGFSDRIPDKSRIASIRATISSYDAENHELGWTYVDIATKVVDESISGLLGFNFNDESLNARNTFSESRLPTQDRNISLFVFGNLLKNKSSFELFFFDVRKTNREQIIAVLPNGKISNSIDTQRDSTYFKFSVKQNLPNNHSGRLSYIFSNSGSDNLGVGGFNLPERAFSSNQREHTFQLSESGHIGKRFFNEFRAEYKYSSSEMTPQNTSPSINVLDAFSGDGAGNESQDKTHKFWLANNFLFGYKNQAIKIGGLIEFEKLSQLSRVNNNGTFLFSSLDDFIFNRPSRFTLSNGDRESNVTQVQIGAYIQDDIQIRKGLSLSLGLRYERQNNLKDANNFAPRVSFTWSPLKTGRITFRGGIGLFYNWFEPSTLSFIRSLGFSQPSEAIIINPSFSNPLSSGTKKILPRSFRKQAEDLKNPYVIHSSLGFGSNLNKKLSLRANYVFERGVNQFRSRNTNAPLNGARPNNDFGNIIQVETSGFFVRNSLDIGFSGIIRKGMGFGINYTLAKKESDVDGIFGLPSDNFNLRLDRSPANDDRRHRINSSISWRIRKGLLVAAIHNMNSPLPYSITTGRDDNGDTIFNDRPLGVSRNSERGAWQSQLDIGASWHFSFFKFKGERKSLTTMTSSDEIARDNSLIDNDKRFSIRLYVSARNILNQTNFTSFAGVQTSPFFGQPISASNPRRVDVGLRFNF